MEKPGVNDSQLLAAQLLEHREEIFAHILSIVRQWNLAEDLFQEVSLVILNKQKEKLEVVHFKAWAREIARRTIFNHWKTTKSKSAILSSESLDAVDEAFQREAEPEENGERLEHLRECLRQIPENLARLVDLRFGENLSYREIGRRVNRSPISIQVTVSKLRMKLLECTKRLESRMARGV